MQMLWTFKAILKLPLFSNCIDVGFSKYRLPLYSYLCKFHWYESLILALWIKKTKKNTYVHCIIKVVQKKIE